MDIHLIWKAAVVVLGGTFLLRVAGRKSISQMTLVQVVIMIGLGSLLVQPIVGRNVWTTLIVGFMLVLSLIILEFGQIKFDFLEKLITGNAKVLIENGQLQSKNMKKVRLTVDQIEMQLRQKQIASLNDVQTATLEPNGQLGFILWEDKRPATKEDYNNVMKEIKSLKKMLKTNQSQFQPNLGNSQRQNQQFQNNQQQQQNNTPPLFNEVNNNNHKNQHPKYLQ